MSIHQDLQLAYGVWENHPLADEIRAAAHFSYAKCYEWFGEPCDPQFRTYIIFQRHKVYCGRYPFLKAYAIAIPKALKHGVTAYRFMSHEMFHRYTMAAKENNLLRHHWVNEMLAVTVQWKIIDEAGFDWYTSAWLKEYSSRNMLTIHETIRVKRSFWKQLSHSNNTGYPEGFYESVTMLGNQLTKLISWEAFCAIPNYENWEAWLENVPTCKQEDVKKLLCL